MRTDLISFSNVKKSFGKKEVLRGISLVVRKGELFGIIGESGTGKTTLLNLLVGYLPLDSGIIAFNVKTQSFVNNKLSTKNRWIAIEDSIKMIRKDFGFSSQMPSFYNKLTVIENLHFFGEIFKVEKQVLNKRINSLIKIFELEGSENSIASDLSGGMRKRLDIACALIHNPSVLILDEPTSNLDPILRKDIWRILKKVNKMGKTLIIASHFVNELEGLCERVAILNKGEVIKQGSPEKLIDNYIDSFEVIIETREKNYDYLINKIKNLKSLKIKNYDIDENKLRIYTEEPKLTMAKAMKLVHSAKHKLIEAAMLRPSLAEVFENLMKK